MKKQETQIAGYTVYCIKFTPYEFDENGAHNKSELVCKHIPFELKESFLNLLKEKNTKLISEEDYNKWYSKQII